VTLRITKPARCRQCRLRLEKVGQVLHEDCVDAFVVRMREEKAERLRKKEREVTRAARERMKKHGELMAEAQDAFNAYIRYRDAGLPCIDCGKPFEPNKPGGAMDAGHFLPRSTSGHLRFNEDNVHGQRKNCNRPGGATRAAYRAGLVAKIGEERVQALEQDYTVRKFARDDFREIRDTYRAKLREMKARKA
jgi:5-methylcytosine-specific restriction endonuclease McrA